MKITQICIIVLILSLAKSEISLESDVNKIPEENKISSQQNLPGKEIENKSEISIITETSNQEENKPEQVVNTPVNENTVKENTETKGQETKEPIKNAPEAIPLETKEEAAPLPREEAKPEKEAP